MKKLLILITGCLLAMLGHAQHGGVQSGMPMKPIYSLVGMSIYDWEPVDIPGFVPYRSKNQHIGLAADSLLYIPVKDTTHTPQRKGGLTYRSADDRIYMAISTTPGTQKWMGMLKYSELGITTRDRFGYTGEDETASAARTFYTNQNKFTFEGAGYGNPGDTISIKNNWLLLDSGWLRQRVYNAGGLSNNYGHYQYDQEFSTSKWRHFGDYKSGCTTCGLNSMALLWYQNASYPFGGVDTLLHTMGAHNGPDDHHFWLADLTNTYANANRLVQFEHNGAGFVRFYNNPVGNFAQTLFGKSTNSPNYASIPNWENWDAIVGGKFAVTDTARFSGQLKYTKGTPGANKVLSSDADGNADWNTLAAIGGVTGTGTTNRGVKFTGTSTIGIMRYYDDGTYAGPDDVLLGTTHTGPYNFISRDNSDGDATSNMEPSNLFASQSSAISTINMAWFKAPNMPSTSHVFVSIGKNNTAKNTANLSFHYQADNSNLNHLEVQFATVNNAMRIYPNRHVTIGNISAESGHGLEVDGTSKFRDTVFNLAPINLTKAGKMVRIVDTATGAVYRIPFDSVGGSGGGGITTLAAIGSSANANGATILGSTLNLEPASGSFGGVVTTVAQTFAGAKTFSSFPTISAATSGRVPYFTTAGLITDASTLTYDGTDFLSSGTGSGNVGLAARNTTSTGRATLKLGNDNSPIAGFIFINGTAKTDYGGANSLGFLNINNAAISFHTNNIDLARLYIGGDGNIGFGTESPTSTLQNTGSTAFAFVTKTVAYTATSSDYTIYCDATSAAFTITLPASSGCQGRIYVIKKTDASGNAITVDGNASETIDGATTYSLATQYKYVTIQSDGSNWFVIGNN